MEHTLVSTCLRLYFEVSKAVVYLLFVKLVSRVGHAVAHLLRHYAKIQKVAGSISDGVIGIIHGHNPSSRTMVLGSTQPLREMSTRNISWEVKAAGA